MQVAQITLDITMNGLLEALTKKLLKKLQEKAKCLSSRRWGTFSVSAVITHYLAHSLYL
jgi:hypothetical protein